MSNKKKYYAVRKGTKCGIFSTWKDCQEAVQNYSGAEYKSFLSEEEARAYLSDRDIYEEEVKELLREGWGVAFVDGSFDTEVGKYGSGVVAFRPDGHKEELFRAGQNPKFIGTKNVAGELFAVLLALDWAVCSEISKLKIYHDYEGVHKWLSSEWKPQSPVSKMYVEIYKHKYEGLLLVDFVKVNGHSNNKYNDLADRLAKESLSKRGRVVKGSSFAAFSYVKKDVWKDLVEKLKETFEGTWESHSETCYQSSDFFRAASGDKVTLTFYS
ncbi:ribonuclease H family protein, partial [Parasutterella excrementihominis]